MREWHGHKVIGLAAARAPNQTPIRFGVWPLLPTVGTVWVGLSIAGQAQKIVQNTLQMKYNI